MPAFGLPVFGLPKFPFPVPPQIGFSVEPDGLYKIGWLWLGSYATDKFTELLPVILIVVGRFYLNTQPFKFGIYPLGNSVAS